MAKIKPQELVVIEWDDHQFLFGESPQGGIAHMRTVGFFVSRSKQDVRVALTIKDGSEFCDVMVIDRRMVGSIKRA